MESPLSVVHPPPQPLTQSHTQGGEAKGAVCQQPWREGIHIGRLLPGRGCVTLEVLEGKSWAHCH